MTASGENHGHQRGDSMTATGEITVAVDTMSENNIETVPVGNPLTPPVSTPDRSLTMPRSIPAGGI